MANTDAFAITDILPKLPQLNTAKDATFTKLVDLSRGPVFRLVKPRPHLLRRILEVLHDYTA